MTTMYPVSYTAQWMAAARAEESQRPDALFTDPLAHDLATNHGYELLHKYANGGLAPFVVIRTKFLDDGITSLRPEDGIRQVVLLAAGMDTRAFRLDWPQDVVLYEVDHAALTAEKQRLLDGLGATPKVERRTVAADLTTDWLPGLIEAGFDPDVPTLWVVEALTFFLTDDQAHQLFRTLADSSAAGSRLELDILGKALLGNPFSRRFLEAMREDGRPWLFGTDEPEEFLAADGWKIRELKEPGEPGVGENRWDYAVQPRDRRGANRLWLIRAEVVGRQ